LRLWGKLVSAIFLIAASVFVVVGVLVPPARIAVMLAAAISLFVALVGAPWLVRVFSTFTGDEAVLQGGVPATAAISKLQPTRWSFGRYSPIVRFELMVNPPKGREVIEILQAVEPKLLARLKPGVVVAIRLDPANSSRAAIDWREPVAGAD
jgi:hypothetical protein